VTKNILTIALTIALVAALIGGGTMAWLSAKDNAPEAAFTAGDVMIEAGGTQIRSQYFDPGEHVFVYGILSQSTAGNLAGSLYEIDVENQTQTLLYENLNTYPHPYGNGLAFDEANGRLYFTLSTSGSVANQLWFYDFAAGDIFNANPPSGFALTRNVCGAAFGDGYYWYIPDGSTSLRRMSFNPDGTYAAVETVATLDPAPGGFGDIVYRDGIVYGSTQTRYFTYDISAGDYTIVYTHPSVTNAHNHLGVNLQLAWGSDGTLYGHSYLNRTWWDVNPATGIAVQIPFAGSRSYGDLASSYVSYWNPGDCGWARYRVHNTGSKAVRVRASVSGEWEFNWGWLWDNHDALCFNEKYGGMTYQQFQDAVLALEDPVEVTLCEGVKDWVLEEDGYFYYIGEPILHCQTVRLCLRVCLLGDKATNEFQGGRYSLTVSFDAAQASNNAPAEVWGVDEGKLWE